MSDENYNNYKKDVNLKIRELYNTNLSNYSSKNKTIINSDLIVDILASSAVEFFSGLELMTMLLNIKQSNLSDLRSSLKIPLYYEYSGFIDVEKLTGDSFDYIPEYSIGCENSDIGILREINSKDAVKKFVEIILNKMKTDDIYSFRLYDNYQWLLDLILDDLESKNEFKVKVSETYFCEINVTIIKKDIGWFKKLLIQL